MTIPCLPTSQLYIYDVGSVKFTNNETLTVKSFSSSLFIGGNRGSLIEEVMAYSESILESLAGENVPIHPLNESCFFHVTNNGTYESANVFGYSGSGLLLSLATITSKQY